MTLFSNVYEVDNTTSGKPILFKVVDENELTIDPSEGFNIFYFKDETVLNGAPKELYMKAEFNNAKNGKITNLMTNSNAVTIDNLVNQLHIKYLLKKDSSRGYFYEIVDDGLTEVNNAGDAITVNLYEIDAL
jgi:hypothetical protein